MVDAPPFHILYLKAGKMQQTKKFATKFTPKDFDITIKKDLEPLLAVVIVTVLSSWGVKYSH